MSTGGQDGEYAPSAADYAPAYSWEEYRALPGPEWLRLEFEAGRLLVSPTGSNAHDFVRQILSAWLERYEEEFPERCVVVAEHSFFMPRGERDYQPDVAVIVDARKDEPIPPEDWIEGAPDIAVEILSPSTRDRDLGLKGRRYFEHGCREYWPLDPDDRSAAFLRRGEDDWAPCEPVTGSYSTPLLPGWNLDLDRLWARLDAKLRRS